MSPNTPESATPSKQERWVAPILSVAQMVSWGAMFYAFAIVLEPMTVEFAASRTRLSATYGFGLLIMGLAAWPVGILIDRGWTREVMTAGSFLAALGLVLQAQANSLTTLYLAWGLTGVAMAATLYEPAFAAMIRAYPRSYRSKITVLTLLGGLASTVFWPLTASLTTQFGWRDALLVLAALQVLICAPIHWLVLPPTDPAVQAATDQHRTPALQLARTKLFLNLTISFSTHLLIMAAVAALLVTMLDTMGLSHQTTLTIVACIGPMQVAGRVLLLVTERRGPSHTATVIVLWLPALALALFAWLSLVDAPAWVLLAFLAAACYGAGNGMLTIIKGTAVAEMVGPQRVATLNGIASIPSAFARAIGPFVIAAIWEFSGSITLALIALFAVAAVSAISFVAAQRHHRANRQ